MDSGKSGPKDQVALHYYYTSPSHWCTTHEVAYRNCKFHNFARTISRHADGISRYSVPPSAGPLLPLNMDDECADDWRESYTNAISGNRLWLTNRFHHTCRLSQLLGARTLKYYRTSQQSIGLVYCNVVYTIQTITISKKNVPPFACYNSGICPIAYAIYFSPYRSI